MKENHIRFATESNMIEGDKKVGERQIEAVEHALTGISDLDDILQLHTMVSEHALEESEVGCFRTIQVYIGNHTPPAPEHVQKQMEVFVRQLPMMDSWQAHNMFQRIHPFVDFNGRTGRLIWLSKAINEGYKFQRSFLHHYYYSTLNHSRL